MSVCARGLLAYTLMEVLFVTARLSPIARYHSAFSDFLLLLANELLNFPRKQVKAR